MHKYAWTSLCIRGQSSKTCPKLVSGIVVSFQPVFRCVWRPLTFMGVYHLVLQLFPTPYLLTLSSVVVVVQRCIVSLVKEKALISWWFDIESTRQLANLPMNSWRQMTCQAAFHLCKISRLHTQDISSCFW